jgi:predicted transcriptional regulator
MTFKQKYTDEMVMEAIQKYESIITLRQVANELKCSKQTAGVLLKRMIASNKIHRVNIGVGARNTWIYKQVSQ